MVLIALAKVKDAICFSCKIRMPSFYVNSLFVRKGSDPFVLKIYGSDPLLSYPLGFNCSLFYHYFLCSAVSTLNNTYQVDS